MEDVSPKISVEYTGKATVATFTDEKILEERAIQAIEKSIMSIIEESEVSERLDRQPRPDGCQIPEIGGIFVVLDAIPEGVGDVAAEP